MAQDLFSQIALQTLGGVGKSAAPGQSAIGGGDDPVSAIFQVAQERGIDPAHLLGLAKLETRAGEKTIKGDGTDTRNLFNVKDFSTAGTGIRARDNAEGSNDRYRQYGSYRESAEDLVGLLERKYPAALKAKSPEEFAQALKAGGYATDPLYERKLANTIRSSAGSLANVRPVQSAQEWDQGARYIPMDLMLGGTDKPKPAEKPKEGAGFWEGTADVGLAAAQGVVGSVKAITDLAGADNAVSRSLDDASKRIEKTKSDASQADRKYHQQKIREAEASGDWKDEVAAYANMVWDMPLESLAQGIGSFATLGAGKVAQMAKLASAAKKAGVTKEAFLKTAQGVEAAKQASNLGAKVNVGLGVSQGIGGVKGSQYEQTFNAAKESGLSDEQAQALATEAQSYQQGWGQQLVGAGLGYLAGKTGPIEKLASGQTVGAGGVARRFVGGGLVEAGTEGLQGGQERYAGNAAAIDAGVLDPSKQWAGVAGSGTSEAITAGILGGGAGALGRPDVDPQAQAKAAAQKSGGIVSRAGLAATPGAQQPAGQTGQAPAGSATAAAGANAAPAQPTSVSAAPNPNFADMDDEGLKALGEFFTTRQTMTDGTPISDEDRKVGQEALAELARRQAAATASPAPAVGQNPIQASALSAIEQALQADQQRRRAAGEVVDDDVTDVEVKAPAQPAAKPPLSNEPDPMLPQAIDFLRQGGKPSVSAVQRQFRIGFNRAARLLEDMQRDGIVGPMDEQGARQILKLPDPPDAQANTPAQPAPSAGFSLPAFDNSPVPKMDPAAADEQRRQAAAWEQKRKVRRAATRSAVWSRNPFLGFLGANGISRDVASEFAPGLVEKRKAFVPGYGPVFRSGAKNLDELVQTAKEDGFLREDDDTPELYDLIERALRGERIAPLYADGAAEAEGQRRQQEMMEREGATFEDYLQQAEADDFDPFPLMANSGYDAQDLAGTDFDQADDAVRAEVAALAAQYADLGFDPADVLEALAIENENQPEQTYYDRARTRLSDLISQAYAQAQPQGSGAVRADRAEPLPAGEAGARGPAAGQQVAPAAPTPKLRNVDELAAEGFNRVVKQGDKTYFVNPDTRESVELDSPAQIARARARVQAKQRLGNLRGTRPQDFALDAVTPEALKARDEQAQAAQAQQTAEQQAAAAQAKADDERKRIEQASYSAADSFELGQNPLDSLTGQQDIFGISQQDAEPVKASLDEMRRKLIQLEDRIVGAAGLAPGFIEEAMKSRKVPAELKRERNELRDQVRAERKRLEDAANTQASPVAADLAGERINDEWTAFDPQSGTLGIPRAEMPQIKAEHRGAMVNFLKARGIDGQQETIPSAAIKPTQAEFSPAKVKQAMDYQGGNRSIIVSADGYVVDGHHQWLAAREKGEPIQAIRLDQNIGDVLAALKDMPSAQPEQGGRKGAVRDYEADMRLYPSRVLEQVGANGELAKLYAKAGVQSADAFGGLSADDQAAAYAEFVADGGKPAGNLPQSYNDSVMEEERQIRRRQLQDERTITQANGKPFKTEAGAKAMMDQFDLGDTHKIVSEGGGYALRQMPPAEQAEVRRKADGRESYMEAQAAVIAEMGIPLTADGEIDATDEQWDEIDQRIADGLGQKPIKPKAGNTIVGQLSAIAGELDALGAPRLAADVRYWMSGDDLPPSASTVKDAQDLLDRVRREREPDPVAELLNQHFKLSAELTEAFNSGKGDAKNQLRLMDESDQAAKKLIELGYTQDQLGANALGVTVDHFKEMVKDGLYSREYGARDELFAQPRKKPKQLGNAPASEQPAAAPAQQSDQASGFDSAAFDKARNDIIQASRDAGNTHLDQLPAYVETMRGKAIFYVHDPKVRGVIRTVDNSQNVYIDWSDAYSAKKEMASPTQDGKKTVYRSTIRPGDFKDYALAPDKREQSGQQDQAQSALDQSIAAADVAAAEKQAAQMIEARIDGMKAADVQRIAARFLPTVGVKVPMGKAKIKEAMTDASAMNLLGPAGELGIELSESVKRALVAKMEGRVGAEQAAEQLDLDALLAKVNDELAAQGMVQNANTRQKRDQLRTAIAERDFPEILKAVDGSIDAAEALHQAFQFSGNEPKAQTIERVLKHRGIAEEYRKRWAERLLGATDSSGVEYVDRMLAEAQQQLDTMRANQAKAGDNAWTWDKKIAEAEQAVAAYQKVRDSMTGGNGAAPSQDADLQERLERANSRVPEGFEIRAEGNTVSLYFNGERTQYYGLNGNDGGMSEAVRQANRLFSESASSSQAIQDFIDGKRDAVPTLEEVQASTLDKLEKELADWQVRRELPINQAQTGLIDEEIAKLQAQVEALRGAIGQEDELDAEMQGYERKAQAEEAARYLKDFVYSLGELDGMTDRAQVELSSPLGKSGRDTLLMKAFGLTREEAHDINNRLDSRQPKKLRNVDMQEAFDIFPGLRQMVDEAIQKAAGRQSAAANADLEAIFDQLDGLTQRTQANGQRAAAAHPQAERIQFVQKHILDILQDLEDTGKVSINC